MKLKIICTLAVLTGLCITSCRTCDEMEETSLSVDNKNTLTRITKENANKKDSTTVSSDENDTKDPPVTGQHWKTKP
ncbi:hypothetical protein [Chryseobacterium salivictor]|uniref:Uncharacterized protein n=1 Tax=Chryseobacterium salivictor TaxID=2547600 RepID=A0A4P6ZIB5_9FLAO|nr:hypothetical protein [Chryseobacterium salivictor]QBO59521.1 hypothetical protein NBC122_02720 [Chryseobacterium salivictor]